MNQFVDPAYLREMPEPLFATFLSSYAFFQNSCCEVATNSPAVFEAVRNRLRCAVDTSRHSIDLHIDNSLGEGLAGESDEMQLESIRYRLLRF